MTEQKAIEILNTKLHLDCKIKEAIDEMEARCVAINALEKQISKPVVFDGNEWTCPHCNTPVLDVNIRWCDICGQKLDWSEEE